MNTKTDYTPRRLFRTGPAAQYLGISRSTLWRLCKQGRLPSPIRVSSRAVAWPVEVLDAYIAHLTEAGG